MNYLLNKGILNEKFESKPSSMMIAIYNLNPLVDPTIQGRHVFSSLVSERRLKTIFEFLLTHILLHLYNLFIYMTQIGHVLI